MKKLKTNLVALSVIATIVASSTPAFAKTNVNTTNINTSTSPILKAIKNPVEKIISDHQPGSGFSGTLWVTGNGVNVRYATNPDTIAYTVNRGTSYYFIMVAEGKGYFQRTSSVTGATILFTIDVRYLSTVPA